jgi:putative ABC transport system ATP-binding protein
MIELRAVTKTVMSGTSPLTILHPLDLAVPQGCFLAITGPSGSGKSTLLGLIAGLDAPTAGQVLVDGTDITSLDEDRLARLRGQKIGFVFQFFHLVPSLTAFENVMVPMEIAGRADAPARAAALLAEVGLTGRGHHYPSQLSGGEQQRVALARALATTRPSSWRTNRRETWTRRTGITSWNCSRTSTAAGARRWYWRRTTGRWLQWPTSSWRCATDDGWKREIRSSNVTS